MKQDKDRSLGENKTKKVDLKGKSSGGAQHTKGKRKSTKQKHTKGQATKKKSYGGEKGDTSRPYPRKRPIGHKGTWPPKEEPDSSPQNSGSEL
jgi:hypothetical protein